jgi:hypothetical protein
MAKLPNPADAGKSHVSSTLSDRDRRAAIGLLLGVDPEHAEMELATREARAAQQRGVFGALDSTTAAPLVACFRAVAGGYPDLDVETLMLLVWVCARWEREGAIPVGQRLPVIVLAPVADAMREESGVRP